MTETTILGTDPLSSPSHSAQHNGLNTRMLSVEERMLLLEAALPTTTANIEQARLAAHEWVVRGPVVTGTNLLLPIIWNLTSRIVEYVAAKATVYAPPLGQGIIVDLVTGDSLTPDPGSGLPITSSILTAPLEIPPGEYASASYSAETDDFSTNMPVGNFVGAYITQVGVDPDPGFDLTIQLDRLL